MMHREPQAIEPLTAADAMALTAALTSKHRRFRAQQARPVHNDNRPATRPVRCNKTKEVVFEISQDVDNCYCARCLSENISTQAETWEKLRFNIRQAVRAFSFGRYRPDRVQVHIIRDETLVLS
jgi:hypothetical protein